MEKNLTGRYIKALVDNPQCTGVEIGEIIRILSKKNTGNYYILETTSSGNKGMAVSIPLNLTGWELIPLETTKKDVFKIDDWIVRTTDGYGHNKVTKGKSYQVIKLSTNTVKVIDDEGKSDCFEAKYFRLAEPHEIPNQELPLKPDMKAVQEECKRRFPIGCKYISSDSFKSTFVLNQDEYTYSIQEINKIYAGSGQGLLYKDGVYAELVSLPNVKEWDENTYAVGLKGNFGMYIGDKNLIEIGKVYTITKEDSSDTTVIAVKDSPFWAYKENFKWFATEKEAKTYASQLTSNKTDVKPSLVGRWLKALEDCPQATFVKKDEYVKILEEKSAGYEVSIGSNPRNKNALGSYGADPSRINLWQLMPEGFNLVSIYDSEYQGCGLDISTPTIKQKPLIENVQSISVNLRTKKQTNKLKF
jgi:hypothetical protein